MRSWEMSTASGVPDDHPCPPSPDGTVARFATGDALPDGRTLGSVTGDSRTLKGGGDGLPEEVPTLLPRIRAEPPAGGDTGGDTGGDAQAAE